MKKLQLIVAVMLVSISPKTVDAAIMYTDIPDATLAAGGTIDINFDGAGAAEFTFTDMGTIEAMFAIIQGISIRAVFGVRRITDKITIFTPAGIDHIPTSHIIFRVRAIKWDYFCKIVKLSKKRPRKIIVSPII